MSYILDALNKSEQERSRKQLPGIDTVHRRLPQHLPRRPAKWIVLLALLAVVNAALLAWWLMTTSKLADTDSNQPQAILPAIQAPAATAPATFATGTAAPGAVTQPPAVPPTAIPGVSPAVATPFTTEREILVTPDDYGRHRPASAGDADLNAVNIAALPVDVQQRLPALLFSSHIYADDSALRMVNINGKSLREGDMVATGVRLLRISEEGVILQYQAYTFEVSVLRDWSL